jgi:galactokinase
VAIVRAPGRVNLIGDHTDYQGGLCLPMAIDREVVVEHSPRGDGRVVVHSRNLGGRVELPVDGSVDPAGVEPAWGRMVAAVLQVLAAHGRPARDIDAVATSSVPIGSGLSSSAAFAVACLLAAGEELPGRELALGAQEAEHLASGVPCGVMDQMASVFGRADHALLLDCRSLAVDPVPLPPAVGVVVVHSGLPRRLETSAYAQRRVACEEAAGRLGVPALRDATLEQVVDDPIARHVVTENARVLEFARAMRLGDVAECGRLMRASHASLRDDFAVSTPELDALVDLCVRHGAAGARLTGAGFGGCIVALVHAGDESAIVDATVAEYGAATGLVATGFPVRAADGAGPVL